MVFTLNLNSCKSVLHRQNLYNTFMKVWEGPQVSPYTSEDFRPAIYIYIFVFDLAFTTKNIYYCKNTPKVLQSNFLSTVIFNFDYVFFLGISCHFIVIFSLHWVSATNEPLVWSQKGLKKTFCDQTNDSFVALTQCHKQIKIKWQLMPKKKTYSKLKFTLLRPFD